MSEELNLAYNRDAIRKRHIRNIKKIEKWREDIDQIIQLLIVAKQTDKAKEWSILSLSLEVVRDLWRRLIQEL